MIRLKSILNAPGEYKFFLVPASNIVFFIALVYLNLTLYMYLVVGQTSQVDLCENN